MLLLDDLYLYIIITQVATLVQPDMFMNLVCDLKLLKYGQHSKQNKEGVAS